MGKPVAGRMMLGIVAMAGLVSVYVFQDAGWVRALRPVDPSAAFLAGKVARFLLNDAFALLLIWCLFPTRGHLYTAALVQLAGMVFFLFPYLYLKVGAEASDGPLVSFLHRLVLNPTLLLLMIPAFYFLDKEPDQVD